MLCLLDWVIIKCLKPFAICKQAWGDKTKAYKSIKVMKPYECCVLWTILQSCQYNCVSSYMCPQKQIILHINSRWTQVIYPTSHFIQIVDSDIYWAFCCKFCHHASRLLKLSSNIFLSISAAALFSKDDDLGLKH